MNKRMERIYRLLMAGECGELFVRALRNMAAYVQKHRQRTSSKRCIDYEISSYSSRILRGPRIRLIKAKEKEMRLNVVLPHFHEGESFGGIRSAMELVHHLSVHYQNIRFVSCATIREKDLFDFNKYLQNPSQKKIEIASVCDGDELVCHENEIFFCTLWRTVAVWESYSEISRKAGFRGNPFYYFIQDFEPGFYPFGYEYATAQKTYSHHEFTHAVINSRELYEFLKMLPLSFAKEYVVRPSLDVNIFDHLKRCNYTLREKHKKTIQILIYGRDADRNCFESIIEGLYLFFKNLPPEERQRYSIICAGGPIESIALLPGIVMRSVGKLPMKKYIEELERSHVGISFMESPHPSFPPLEMATFGLYTITNKFLNKDLSQYHPMIHSVDYPLPDELALALKEAVDYISKTDVSAIQAVVPGNMSLLSWRENFNKIGITPITSNNA